MKRTKIFIFQIHIYFYVVCSDVGLLLYICNWLHKSRFHCALYWISQHLMTKVYVNAI